ncbi:NADH-quinone oxidoreductase subunit F, partial [bacterium]
MALLNSREDFEALAQRLKAERPVDRPRLAVCSGTGCNALKSAKIAEALAEEVQKQGLSSKYEVTRMGCHGLCERGPIVMTFPDQTVYMKVSPDDAAELVKTACAEGGVVERLLYQGPAGERMRTEEEIPFYKNQLRLVFGQNRLVARAGIEEYIAASGYSALVKTLFEMTPEDVVAEVKNSGLRGRGGGGFPAGVKWETARNAPGSDKYVIVNADEGDPGAFMDGALLEGNPHRVLEGLFIGGYAIGASKGFVYIRQEYPLALASLHSAVELMRKYGLLGENILGSGFSFDVKIHRGAGSFVSGESSALMSSLEGKVGEPRAKYIRTSVAGVHGRPSNLNNVETWATIPIIIDKGAQWFASVGTKSSTGTKIFSLVGKVVNTGLVEVPMGTSLRKIIYE